MPRNVRSYHRSFIAASTLVLLAAAALSQPALAGTATTTLGVSLTINAGCNVSSSSVAFPAQSVLASAVSQSGSVNRTRTNTPPYNVRLHKSAGAGATVSNPLV